MLRVQLVSRYGACFGTSTRKYIEALLRIRNTVVLSVMRILPMSVNGVTFMGQRSEKFSV